MPKQLNPKSKAKKRKHLKKRKKKFKKLKREKKKHRENRTSQIWNSDSRFVISLVKPSKRSYDLSLCIVTPHQNQSASNLDPVLPQHKRYSLLMFCLITNRSVLLHIKRCLFFLLGKEENSKF